MWEARMTIQLSAEQEKLIQDRVKSGEYSSPEDLISAAIARLVQDERLFKGGELDALLKVGTDELDRGEMLDGEKVFEDLRNKSAAVRAGKNA
jgi:antitoxin ParD1/3/4